MSRILLTEDEMKRLNDGQDWYVTGDVVYVEGYLPQSEDDNPSFQLDVNGTSHDNWISWSDMPRWLKKRLQNGKIETVYR